MRPLFASAREAKTMPDNRLHVSDLIPLNKVSDIWPKPVHVSVPHRWRDPGVSGVRLRVVKVPGVGWCTTRDWLAEFITAVTAAKE